MAGLMINDNNNTLEIEIFILFLDSLQLSPFIVLPPLALTIFMHYDMWIIAAHHLFSWYSLFFLCTGLYKEHSQTIPLHITHNQLALQTKLSEANRICGREGCNKARINSINQSVKVSKLIATASLQCKDKSHSCLYASRAGGNKSFCSYSW